MHIEEVIDAVDLDRSRFAGPESLRDRIAEFALDPVGLAG